MYPIGIPVLYIAILWNNRELLNPRIATTSDEANEATPEAKLGSGDDMPFEILRLTPTDRARYSYYSEELQELQGKVKARRDHPKLIPSMFLWKDYGKSARVFGTSDNVGANLSTLFLDCCRHVIHVEFCGERNQ